VGPSRCPSGLLGLIDAIDGWNREDATWAYDFDRKRYVCQRPSVTLAGPSRPNVAQQGP
jgi:hypothetical protein